MPATNVLIITSSYPSHPDDSTGAAGLFVREFALQLVHRGVNVEILVPTRKPTYIADVGIRIKPLVWRGGDQELASVNLKSLRTLWIVFVFFLEGCRGALRCARENRPQRILCMWAVPSGLFGWWISRRTGIPYDVWALGSDVWRVRRLPLGRTVLRIVISAAAHVFADGMQLARDVEELSGRSCEFLASSRLLPVVPNPETGDSARLGSRFMFVGRYHKNKGPDVLLDAISRIPEEDRKSIHVDMYGFGPLKDQLQEFVRNNDLQRVVSIHGTIDALQLARELARTEFLIIPSRIESIPVILSDAVQVGVPLIVSDVGDLGEVVRSAEAGIVVAPEDPSELAAAILDASRLGPVQYHSGVQRLSSMFNIGSVCDRWLNREAIRS